MFLNNNSNDGPITFEKKVLARIPLLELTSSTFSGNYFKMLFRKINKWGVLIRSGRGEGGLKSFPKQK